MTLTLTIAPAAAGAEQPGKRYAIMMAGHLDQVLETKWGHMGAMAQTLLQAS